jgi:DNA (cytosine-5)-methyltransferase 1
VRVVNGSNLVRYGSVCSGIEAFSVAVNALGWQPQWFAEIDPFCCEVLKRHYPEVLNHGDITQTPLDKFEPVDVVVGGTPCQSFSIQGSKRGLADPRGQLAIRFCEIVSRCRPRWVIWENVANVVNVNGGADFESFLSSVEKCGYSLAWRVLDAQFFGVPQRRRRVFVVGHYRHWGYAAAALFEPRANREDAGPSRKVQARKLLDRCAKDGAIGWSGDETPKGGVNVIPTLRASQGGEGVGVVLGRDVIRLNAKEWERAQGIPDDYTKLAGWSDSQRRKALGNSFAVPVMRWIAEGIADIEAAGK